MSIFEDIANAAAVVLPQYAAPIKVIGVLLSDASDKYYSVSVEDIRKAQSAAGAAANNAAHLAGLREAIRRVILASVPWDQEDEDDIADEVTYIQERIMDEVLKRWPQ